MAIESKTGLGGTISITADAPASYDESGFTTLTFDKIEGVVSNGRTTGVSYGTTSFIDLETGETIENKTSIAAQEFTMMIPEDTTSTGREALDLALESKDYVSFEIVNGAGNTKYFEAYVTGRTFEEGDTENTEMASYTIKPRARDAVYVAATTP